MKYVYTDVNLIDNPHNYMYTTYHGKDFINSYFKNRSENIKKMQSQSEQFFNSIDLYFYVKSKFKLKECLQESADYCNFENNLDDSFDLKKIPENFEAEESYLLTSYNLEAEIDTEKLLSALLLNQLKNRNNDSRKEIINLLVQRFEVTKKLYKTYLKGFHNGTGKKDIIRLYWIFALLLNLYYLETKNVKYLSTLLKVSDLLCSLSDKVLLDNKAPKQILILILSAEKLNIQALLKNIKGGNLVFE